MTKEQIGQIFERVRTWPPERQEDAAEALLMLERQNGALDHLTDEDWADLEEAVAEAEREEPVPQQKVRALFDRYRGP